jgi:hypothetical protein
MTEPEVTSRQDGGRGTGSDVTPRWRTPSVAEPEVTSRQDGGHHLTLTLTLDVTSGHHRDRKCSRPSADAK